MEDSSGDDNDPQLNRVNVSSSATERDTKLTPRKKQKIYAGKQKKIAAQPAALEQQLKSASVSLLEVFEKQGLRKRHFTVSRSFFTSYLRFLTPILAIKLRAVSKTLAVTPPCASFF